MPELERHVMTPLRHKQIDVLYRQNKNVFDRGIVATIHIADQAERARSHKPTLTTNRQASKDIETYLDFMRFGINMGIDILDLGMWLQGVLAVLDPHSQNGKVPQV